MKKILVVLMTLVLIFLGINAASATTVNINPSADTSIGYTIIEGVTYDNDVNFGSSVTLRTTDLPNWYGSSYMYRTLLKFDLNVIPLGATVTSATLTMYASILTANSDHVPVEVHRMANDAWVESGITWQNADTSFTTSFASNLLDTQPFPSDSNPQPWLTVWNLSSWVSGNWSQDRMDGLVTFLLNEQSNFDTFFASIDEFEKWPVLTITYNNPVPISPTVWLFGSGLLGLAGWRLRKR
jgi:hypothetical protein